jgi:hypothetical protein
VFYCIDPGLDKLISDVKNHIQKIARIEYEAEPILKSGLPPIGHGEKDYVIINDDTYIDRTEIVNNNVVFKSEFAIYNPEWKYDRSYNCALKNIEINISRDGNYLCSGLRVGFKLHLKIITDLKPVMHENTYGLFFKDSYVKHMRLLAD